MDEDGFRQEINEAEQILGKALNYPWYYKDKANFPDAVEADGVCVGENTLVSLCQKAASEIDRLGRLVNLNYG